MDVERNDQMHMNVLAFTFYQSIIWCLTQSDIILSFSLFSFYPKNVLLLAHLQL